MTIIALSFLALLTLAVPLYYYKHRLPMILGACGAEAVCIAIVYGSTFILCEGKNHCSANLVGTVIPILVMVMNVGMFWPLIAGYARKAKIDEEQRSFRKKKRIESIRH